MVDRSDLRPPRSIWARACQWAVGSEAARWTFRREFNWFFGPDFQTGLQAHEKVFPGYDLASVNLALDELTRENCVGYRELGGAPYPNLSYLIAVANTQRINGPKPGQVPFQRMPVDVGREESFSTNRVALALYGEKGDRILILLSASSSGGYYVNDFDVRYSAPAGAVQVGIACRDREVADRFFADLEARRKRLNVYRGKVIDPALVNGSIAGIGFRPIRPVSEDDLILPDVVKQLVRGSIVGFYRHRDALIKLGIEMKRGILFHSPPGTGKTSISLYLAGLLPQFTICFVSGERLLHPREVCQMARYLQPTMVVFEDIDLIAQERDANGLATVLGELMNQIDGCEPADQVLFIMNTNSLERLEHAVRNRPGRVDQIIAVPLPDVLHREKLIRHFGRPLRWDLDDFRRVLDATDGATPALIKEVVKRAAVLALERDGVAGEEIGVTETDLLLAADQVRSLRDPERDAVPGGFGFRNA